MLERSIFMQALDCPTVAERSALLDEACAHDPALRQRVEALLSSHASVGSFLGLPVPERLAEQLEFPSGTEETQPPQSDEGDEQPLEFLAPSDSPGSLGKLGHYEVQEVIGRGGMGIVLRAFDERLHRVVAIKVMAAQLATSATARKRFIREARAAAAISHDHIVTIHAVEEASGLPYIAMHYVAGQSLQQRLDQNGPLELPEILRIGTQTAAGLAAAHAQGLIHRDIKPANILLENGVERVKITDFGLARAAADASLTQTGTTAGTPQYMAPEQARGEALDARTDLFGLGSVLYAMCTGRSPFRGSNTLSVLKRVCEETPSPIRETNPAIPDFLVAIVAKLQAKDPADRYQTAAKVAELLNEHLAHLQHPSVVPLPAVEKPARQAPVRLRLWAIAAAVLLCLALGLGLTEATGTTQLTATVIRIFTSDGTLVVEVDDPAVRVTIEGDGGLVLTGAGLEEIRLRPGSYKVQADRDGKPVVLDREVVSIAKGGREVVKVKLEAPPAVVARTEKGAFVLLGGKGVVERKFDTLAKAVLAASNGDTIEVRGNGPFFSEPINIQRTALTIRAGGGFRPVIKLSPERVQPNVHLLTTNAALVLEGLELHHAPSEDPWSGGRAAVNIDQASLRAANCRFRAPVYARYSSVCSFRNCEFLADFAQVNWRFRSGTQVSFENCVYWTKWASISSSYHDAAPRDILIQVKRSTFVSGVQSLALALDSPLPASSQAQQASQPIRLEVSGSVFDATCVLGFGQTKVFLDEAAVFETVEAEAMLLRLLQWRGERNVLPPGGTSVRWLADLKPQPPHGPKSLEEWQRFWGTAEPDSLEGPLRFQGGNLLARTADALDQLTPADFRLRPDSSGYRAGPDGKDLGADVDLVGPGAAYERWKKTPAYQEWLKDTKQITTQTPKPELQAFVVLDGKGIEVRKCNTLDDAVLHSAQGDTIEIRGDGPFVSDGVTIQHPLVIRAGEGHTPSITLSQASADRNVPLLNTTSASLVLEGLELRRIGGATARVGNRIPNLLYAWHGGTLHVVNCRFVFHTLGGIGNSVGSLIMSRVQGCTLQNCQFSTDCAATLGWYCPPGARGTIENCVTAAGGLVNLNLRDPDLTDVVVQLCHNTTVGDCLGLGLYQTPKLTAEPLVRLDFSANVTSCSPTFGRRGTLRIDQVNLEPPLPAQDAEVLLPSIVDLHEQHNVYAGGTRMLQHAILDSNGLKALEATRGKNLADWDRLWEQQNTGSVEGIARFQSGDLLLRAQIAPEQLTAEDFRLRPDSAGYRAGPDGKDLGADVDLVGPGPAYERWKKTSEYEQWLKNTGQVK